MWKAVEKVNRMLLQPNLKASKSFIYNHFLLVLLLLGNHFPASCPVDYCVCEQPVFLCIDKL